MKRLDISDMLILAGICLTAGALWFVNILLVAAFAGGLLLLAGVARGR